MHRQTQRGTRLRTRGAELRAAADKAGVPSDDGGLAEFLGFRRTTIFRNMRGEVVPTGYFIAAVLTAFPRNRFEDLFEVVIDERVRSAA